VGSADRKFTYWMSCIVVSTELSSTNSMMEISDYTYHDDDDDGNGSDNSHCSNDDDDDDVSYDDSHDEV